MYGFFGAYIGAGVAPRRKGGNSGVVKNNLEQIINGRYNEKGYYNIDVVILLFCYVFI